MNLGEKQFSATSPLRYKPERQNENVESFRGDATSGHNSASHSRSRSGYRKMSKSPVEINTSYELSHKNTENLWKEFRSNIRDKSSPRQTRPLRRKTQKEDHNEVERVPLSEKNMQRAINNFDKNSVGTFQGNSYEMVDEVENERQKSSTHYITPNHGYKPSFASNIDTNQFVDTSKTEIKNQLMDERHIKKLIKVTGKLSLSHLFLDSNKVRTTLRDNLSFAGPTQVLPSIKMHDIVGSNRPSHASQFTFNSTEKVNSNDYDESKSNYTFKDGEREQFVNHLNLSQKSRIRIISGPNTFEGNREEMLDQQEFPIMNSVRQVIQAHSNTRDYGQNGRQPATKKSKSRSRSRSRESSKGGKSKKSSKNESTQVIRDRLKCKIETLRSKLSSSHHDTIRSTQDKLNVQLARIPQHNKDKMSQNIETMRIHSRDGSKSIEGSGLELDDYVSLEDHKQDKYSYVEKADHLSSKYETYNTIDHQFESHPSHNSLNSKSQEQFAQQPNQLNFVDIKNNTNVTQFEKYFVNENNSKTGDSVMNSATQTKLLKKQKIGTKRNSSNQIHSSKSANRYESNILTGFRSFNKRSNKLSSEKQSKSKSKRKNYDYSANTSIGRSGSRSRSGQKYKQPKSISKVIMSNKNRFVNTDTIHNVKSEVYFR